MRRIAPVLIVLALLAPACGEEGALGSSTTAVPTSAPASTTTEVTAPPSSTTEATTTTAATTTTVPGSTPVTHTAYCVRGTASNDGLNVRSGPGAGFDILGELAWNAADVPAGGFAADDDRGRPWYLVQYEGGVGWAAGWYLEPAPCTAASITVAPLAGAGLPDALAGSLVPWTWVGEEWVLALYAPDWNGPHVLYLLSPYGDLFEVFSWAGSAVEPYDLYDWRPDGQAVLLRVGLEDGSHEIRRLDLLARTSALVLAIPELGEGGPAAYTRPTGRDLVVKAGDAVTELLEVRRTDGSLFSTLVSRPRPADRVRESSWIYGLEGTSVVVGDGTGLLLLSNQGALIRNLAAPGEACRPVRWWDASTILARCLAPEILAYEPNSFYGRLWLVPSSGAAATPLTALPAGPVEIVDFGFFDAWRADGKVFASWAGDCSAAAVHLVRPDGTTAVVTSSQLVGTIGAALVVRRWTSCGEEQAGLHLVDGTGNLIRDLLVPPSGAPGVNDALMMRDLP